LNGIKGTCQLCRLRGFIINSIIIVIVIVIVVIVRSNTTTTTTTTADIINRPNSTKSTLRFI
jgi:hypothetical protein